MHRHPISVDDLPNEECFAILYPESVTIPGDERSRTNPGHGYPESTEHYWRMEIFPTKEEWEKEIIRLENRSVYKTPFKAVKFIPAKISTKVEVSVE